MKNITKALVVIVLSLSLTGICFATGQAPDKLIIGNKVYDLFSNPLEDYYKSEKDRPAFKISADVMSSTGNWRGYVATWEIEGKILYLREIDAVICNFQEFTAKKCRKAELRELFGDKYANDKVKAHWFSGELRIPDGRRLEYVHMGYGSVYERDIILTVQMGKITKRTVIDNTKKARPSNLELQRQELEKLKRSPIGDRDQLSDNSSELLIVAGKGCGRVSLGVARKTVESVIGEGQKRSQYDDVYFIDYPTKGIQISYNNIDDTLDNAYFYNGQYRYENFATFDGKTDKGVDWKSSPQEVIEAYGKPKEDYAGEGWRRIVFDGIDFRWENGVMVRIGIPGK